MKQKRWTAILLAVSLAAAMTGCAPGVESCPAADQTQPGAAYETLAEATYPEMAKYPDETAYMKKDGAFESGGDSLVWACPRPCCISKEGGRPDHGQRAARAACRPHRNMASA